MKRCCRCSEEKPLTEFNKSARYRDGRQTHCRACAALYYQGNRDRHNAGVKVRNTRVRRENAQLAWNYLVDHPCVDCGETNPIVLDFDHVRGKKHRNISEMICQTYSWTTIMEEISKCVVRCANCHRRRTAVQFAWYAHVVR